MISVLSAPVSAPVKDKEKDGIVSALYLAHHIGHCGYGALPVLCRICTIYYIYSAMQPGQPGGEVSSIPNFCRCPCLMFGIIAHHLLLAQTGASLSWLVRGV